MTIQVEMQDGSIVEFADDATPEEILKITGPVRLAPEEIKRLDERPPAAELSLAEGEPPGGRRTRWPTTVQPYEPDDEAEFEERLSPTVRELLRRSRLPSSRAAEPSEDVFRDNWWPNWHGRR